MGLLVQVFKWDQRWRVLHRVDILLRRGIKKQAVYPTKLAEVGRLIEARDDRYETGQLFLHRIFGYRGVILFPWTARVYDRDLHNPSKISATSTTTASPTQQQRTKESSLRVKANTSSPPTAATVQSGETPTSAAFQTDAPGEAESTTNVGTATQ
uniref:Uncharacterized protein LOC108039753 n=1 Tax=Drosophila rhopaloa TaxID=1041015 RepID=A0A6P4EAZ5_DRORH